MAKMEKIRKMQIADNKENKFFYFPMISMPCTGSEYEVKAKSLIVQCLAFSYFIRIYERNLGLPDYQ